jgi:hypothetical protein
MRHRRIEYVSEGGRAALHRCAGVRNRTIHAFMQEVPPGVSEETRALAGDLITTTLSQVGKDFSDPRTPAEIEACADAMSDMFCAYLTRLSR